MTWLDTLPPGPGYDREHLILTAIIEGHHDPIVWAPVHSGPLTLWVAEDAIRIDGVRMTVTHRTAQQIADYFGARLPTVGISDLTWCESSVRIPAMPQVWWQDGTMALTRRMVEHSTMVDRAIGKRPGLVADVGKDWILVEQLQLRPDLACNYGWRDVLHGKPFQGVGLAHNLEHTDYSQSVRLVCRTCDVDGVRTPLDQVIVDPAFSQYLTHGLPLTITRHPGVPYVEPDAPLEDPPCTS